MGGSSQTTTSTSQSQPWGPSATALKTGYSALLPALQQSQDANSPPTDFTAGLTPQQLQTFGRMLGYSQGTAPSTDKLVSGQSLTDLGASGAAGALSAYGGFNPTDISSIGNTIDAAKQYQTGFDIPGAVDNAMLQAKQTARDVTLPMIDNAAASTGNTNSSRTALERGLVERGLAEKAAGLSADLQNQTFSQGANLGFNTNQGNVDAILRTIEGAGALGNRLATTGSGMQTGAYGDVGQLFNLANQAGQGLQTGNQLNLTNQNQQYLSGVQSPYAPIAQYMQLLGPLAGAWQKSTGTQTTSSNPGALNTIGGLMSGLGSFFSLSDANAKTDIKSVGRLDNGLTVYTFRYEGDDEVRMGLLAQEVEKLHPDAIRERFGLKFVDYNKATR